MKNLMSVLLVGSLFTLNANAYDASEAFGFPPEKAFLLSQSSEEQINVAQGDWEPATLVYQKNKVSVADAEEQNLNIRRGFIGKRPFGASRANNNDTYKADDQWEGTGIVKEPLPDAIESGEEKTNLHMYSRRPYMKKSFD